MAFVKELDFTNFLEQQMQITRSAIFSFALMVRHEGAKNIKDFNLFISRNMHRKNFED